MQSAIRAVVMGLMLPAIAGCSGVAVDTSWLGSSSTPAQPAAAPTAPPVNLAGLWQFSSGGRQCRMTFGAQPNAADGTIAPQGGCPGKFYMSRKWTFEGNSLTMRDHTGQPLAQLESQGAAFEGKATTGEPVTLLR